MEYASAAALKFRCVPVLLYPSVRWALIPDAQKAVPLPLSVIAPCQYFIPVGKALNLLLLKLVCELSAPAVHASIVEFPPKLEPAGAQSKIPFLLLLHVPVVRLLSKACHSASVGI